MRNLFLLLLLANLLLLAWQRWIVPPAVVDPMALRGTEAEPQLELLARKAMVPAPGPAEQAGEMVCVRLGPFEEAGGAKQAADDLQQQDMLIEIESSTGEVWVGHWVQIPGFADWAAARQALRKLAAVGLTDAYIVSAEPGYKISLGVFRGREGADRVAAAADAEGFEVMIADRFRQDSELWLAIEHRPGSGPRLSDIATDPDRILRFEPSQCLPRDGQS